MSQVLLRGIWTVHPSPNDELERRARRRQDLPLYRSRARSKRLLCGMLAASPEADYDFLPPRVGFDSALGNGGSPKLRRSGYVEAAAHRAKASSSSADASTCDGYRDRAPRIEGAQRDELSPSAALLLLQLMQHNDESERRARQRQNLPFYRSRARSRRLLGRCSLTLRMLSAI